MKGVVTPTFFFLREREGREESSGKKELVKDFVP